MAFRTQYRECECAGGPRKGPEAQLGTRAGATSAEAIAKQAASEAANEIHSRWLWQFQRPMNRPRSPDAYNKDSAGAALGKPNGCWQSGNIVNGSISSRDFPFLSWHTPPSTPQHNAGLHTSHAPTSTKSFLSTCHMPLTRSSSQNTLVQTLQPQTLGTTLANPPAASDLPCGCSTMRTLPLRSYHMLLFACLPVLAALLLCCCCCCCCCLLLFVFACCFAAAGLPMLLLLVCCFAAAGLRVLLLLVCCSAATVAALPPFSQVSFPAWNAKHMWKDKGPEKNRGLRNLTMAPPQI